MTRQRTPQCLMFKRAVTLVLVEDCCGCNFRKAQLQAVNLEGASISQLNKWVRKCTCMHQDCSGCGYQAVGYHWLARADVNCVCRCWLHVLMLA